MYRIIVVDDEDYVRDLLKKYINQSDDDFEVIATAENGVQALDLVKTLKPDILITDISMPFMDGLELIRNIQDSKQKISTIIISGYDEFSYAKQALALGVTDYLLKPFLPSEMFDVLNKIKEELENQKQLLKNLNDMKNQLENNLQSLQEHFLLNLFNDRINKQNILQEASRLQVNLEGSIYTVGILHLFSSTNSEKEFKDFLDIIKDDYFSTKIKTFSVAINDNQIAVLFCGDYRNHQSFCNAIREGFHEMNESLVKYYDMSLCCSVGNITTDIETISEVYHNAISLWKRVLNPTDEVVFYVEMEKQSNQGELIPERPKKLEENLILNIQMGRVDKSLECLNKILQYYETIDVQYIEFINVFLIDLVVNITNTLTGANGNTPDLEEIQLHKYIKKHFTYGNLRDAKTALEQYVIKSCEEFAEANENHGKRIVSNVKELIENNLDNEEFNLEIASAKLFFSPNYVRQLFKQITGESFTGYLIRRRMEKAKELLQNPHLKIQDVALMTGYSNQRYFASCFKKYYGCTPTEYRSNGCLSEL